MRLGIVSLIWCLALAACSPKVQIPVEENKTPNWVLDKPISPTYYTGVGRSSKSVENYALAAKDNALGDLASEISVQVQSNSFLYTLEREYKFEEEFKSSIQTTSSKNLEGYELVDSWENQGEYWVYYKLSKAQYQAQQDALRQQAQQKALDMMEKAKTVGNFSTTAQYYIQALMHLKPFWGESHEVLLDGKQVYLENEIFHALNDHFGSLHIAENNNQPLELNFANGYGMPTAYRVLDKSQQAVAQVPVFIRYPNKASKYGSGLDEHEESLQTNASGQISFLLKAQLSKASRQTMTLSIDPNRICSSEDPVASKLIQSLPKTTKQVQFTVNHPLLHVTSEELTQTGQREDQPLLNALKSGLINNGFELTSDVEQAEVILHIKSRTEHTASNTKFKMAYLDIHTTATQKSTGKIVFKDFRDNVKGIQLTPEKAEEDAYNKGNEIMQKTVVEKFASQIISN